jgi:hypothetical protein
MTATSRVVSGTPIAFLNCARCSTGKFIMNAVARSIEGATAGLPQPPHPPPGLAASSSPGQRVVTAGSFTAPAIIAWLTHCSGYLDFLGCTWRILCVGLVGANQLANTLNNSSNRLLPCSA